MRIHKFRLIRVSGMLLHWGQASPIVKFAIFVPLVIPRKNGEWSSSDLVTLSARYKSNTIVVPKLILETCRTSEKCILHPLIHTLPTGNFSTRCWEEKSGAEAPPVLQQMNTFISRVAEGFQIRSLEQCERSICHCILCCRGNRFPRQSRKSLRNRLEKMILCSTYKEVSL